MIRINLLPFRALRKKENVRRQIYYYFGAVIIVALLCFYVGVNLNSRLNLLKKEEKACRTRLAELDKVIKEISQMEKEIAEIRDKLAVIKRLEKNKTGPVRLLEALAMAVPKDKLWLTSYQESKGVLTLMGTAMDNETVALFMTNLEKSDYIGAVDLQRTQLRSIPQYNLGVSDFVMSCRTYAFEQKPKTEKTVTHRKSRRGR